MSYIYIYIRSYSMIEIIHITLYWIWISWIGYSALIRVVATPFPLPM